MWRITTAFVLLTSFAGCSERLEPDLPAHSDLILPSQPNILWLVAEDLSPVIPSFGDSTVVTPTLSRLAEEGVRYPNVYSVAGVCAPSRFTLSTGVYTISAGGHHMRTQSRNGQLAGIDLPAYGAIPQPEVKMMSEVLREAGYFTSNNAKTDYQYAPVKTAWDQSGQDAHWHNRAPGQPFFSIFNFEVSHESRIWAKADDPLLIQDDLEVTVPPYLPDNDIGRRDVRRMYSNIIEMDQQVGEILDQLEDDGQLENTIVVWYSDHGGPLPRQKRLLYDSGLRVPMIIRYPNRQRAGEVDDQLISFVDFAPTAMSMAGIVPPGYLQGRAFAGAHASQVQRKYIHAAADRLDAQYDMIRAVRGERFKYLKNYKPDQPYYLPVVYREQMPIMQELLRMREAGELDEYQAQWFRETKDPEELFDTWSDPHELNNLAGDPDYAEKLEEMRAEESRWTSSVGDLGLIPERALLERFWPEGEQPEVASPDFVLKGDMLALQSSTPGASIGYQILEAGQSPGSRWLLYTGEIPVPVSGRIVAIGDRIGYRASPASEFQM